MSIAELPKPRKARTNGRRSAKAVDGAPSSGPKPNHTLEQRHDPKTSSFPQSGQGSLGETRAAAAGGDAWTSNLVRRRRQLEREAALANDQQTVNTVVTASATQLTKQAMVPNDQDLRTTIPRNSTVVTGQALDIGGLCDHSKEVLTSSKQPASMSPSQMIKQEPRPERHPPRVPARAQPPSEKPSAPASGESHVEAKPSRSSAPVSHSYLKVPHQCSTKAPLTSSSAPAPDTVAAARAHSPAGVDPQAKARAAIALPVRSQPAEAPVRASVDCSSKSSSKAGVEHHVRFACPEDDDDLLSAEEERLRQSLEKLDSRLTKLNSDTKQQQQQQHKSDSLVPQDPRTTGVQSSSSAKAPTRALSTGGYRKDDIEIADFVDDDVVAAAAYGGGAHRKSGQVTSALERSCYTRRAEMSSGLHKLRVRTGGAMAQESNTNSANLDKEGKHKVVVKKDLAHLLF